MADEEQGGQSIEGTSRQGRGTRSRRQRLRAEAGEGEESAADITHTDQPSQPTHLDDAGIEMENVADGKADRRGARRKDDKADNQNADAAPRHDESKSRDAAEKNENKDNEKEPTDAKAAVNGPLKILEPVRTDPVKVLQARQRRIERLHAATMPEVHVVGQITSGRNLFSEPGEGAFVRWKVEYGKSWQHLSGNTLGQTQIAYPLLMVSDTVPFNHPIDLHFAESGLQGFGALRVCIQTYKMDPYGRRILNGYGFVHIPVTSGFHRLEANLWRPAGSPEAEVDAMMLGRVPALVTSDPLYTTAWRERCRLVTVGAGTVFLELFVLTRHMKPQGIDGADA